VSLYHSFREVKPGEKKAGPDTQQVEGAGTHALGGLEEFQARELHPVESHPRELRRVESHPRELHPVESHPREMRREKHPLRGAAVKTSLGW